MLHSAEVDYRLQQRYAAVGIAAARRAWRLGSASVLVPALTLLQRYAARDSAEAVAEMLAEQGIDAPPVAEVNPAAFAGVASDGRPLASLLQQAESLGALELMTVTQLADAGRGAAGVAIATRPKIGWTRMVNPPCCARCGILAGKFFRWNQGFQRHPRCDCRHIPTAEDRVGDVRTDPAALFNSGQITGVTKAEQKAITAGADVNRVINARRSLYMDTAGHRLTREAARGRIRPAPEQIYRDASSQADAIRLLTRFGYIL